MCLLVDEGQPDIAELDACLDERADGDNDSGLWLGDSPPALSAPAEAPRPPPPIRPSLASLQLMEPWASFAEAMTAWASLPENLKFPPAARSAPGNWLRSASQVLRLIPLGKTSCTRA